MNYLEAKIELMKDTPQISLHLLAAELAAMTAVAALLVYFFA